MKNYLSSNKNKIFFSLGICAFAVLLVFYIYALTRPGVWHGKTFLYLQDNASYVGNGAYFDYNMTIDEQPDGTDISFSVDDLTRKYFIQSENDGRSVTIYEDDELVFEGFYQSGFLMNENDIDIQIHATTSNIIIMPKKEDYFPTRTHLYEWAVMDKPEMRGNFVYVFCIVFIALFLAIDFRFPDFFFQLKHFLTVEGGSPTDFYRTTQWIGRIVLVILATVCVFLSLSGV